MVVRVLNGRKVLVNHKECEPGKSMKEGSMGSVHVPLSLGTGNLR